jgi:hypothetical protein
MQVNRHLFFRPPTNYHHKCFWKKELLSFHYFIVMRFNQTLHQYNGYESPNTSDLTINAYPHLSMIP